MSNINAISNLLGSQMPELPSSDEALERPKNQFARRLEIISQINRPIEQKMVAEETKFDAAKKRILEVGMAQYQREQAEIRKMEKVLLLMKMEVAEDLKPHVEHFIEHFKENPPKNVGEMLNYMEAYVKGIPKTAPNNLRQRMEDVLEEIYKLMNFSEDEINRMLQAAEHNQS